MTFKEVLMESAKNKELVKEFDRLTHSNLSMSGVSINLMIDKATGKLDSSLRAFIIFVYDCIYTRIEAKL